MLGCNSAKLIINGRWIGGQAYNKPTVDDVGGDGRARGTDRVAGALAVRVHRLARRADLHMISDERTQHENEGDEQKRSEGAWRGKEEQGRGGWRKEGRHDESATAMSKEAAG